MGQLGKQYVARKGARQTKGRVPEGREMAALVDKIVVIDIEATCWPDGVPEGEKSDTIEIGVVPLDVRTLKIAAANRILTKPTRSSISAFCTRLTGITQEEAANGIALSEGCALLRREYESNKRLWASYGDYDRRMFETCCAELDIPYPFGHGHLNVKTLLAVTLGLPCEVNLETALEKVGLEFLGRPHCGKDDAFNTARLLALLFERGRLPSTVEGSSKK
jgi:inhibitor of KinA sporulation pathway (predicted exonuclease)